ncbi:MAG: hypothetical protein KME07_22130 [Pegethrix bostrychoides GSE-TBD4-15B]|jgi:hypothetical protein|uniref:Uncharacterized protein n=1 Tax=Pegethrix bostrychoides GSE-TBD4-15B TaxID=2839662 RepID=A0A951U6P5_9CYAN|nr:hypothetical protein [Pegethrix bostrychoides GSE-TBD4-15B]
MTALFIDIDATQAALQTTAAELQARLAEESGERYRIEDLQTALAHWLELSIESLVEDALFHAHAGDRSYAFNRRAFETQLRKLPAEAASSQAA